MTRIGSISHTATTVVLFHIEYNVYNAHLEISNEEIKVCFDPKIPFGFRQTRHQV